MLKQAFRRTDEFNVGVIRRAALVFSLVLIVAIAVGYVARRAELAGERDLRITTAAELAASRLVNIVDTVSVAAASADADDDPATTAAALASIHPRLGVCVVAGDTTECLGTGPMPPPDAIDANRAARFEGIFRWEPAVTVYDQQMTIVADGPYLSVIAHGPADAIAADGDVSAWATTFLPSVRLAGGFAVEQGVRQTALIVDGAPGVYVIAAGQDEVMFPTEEARFYMIIFALAVILLVLAGITLVVEQRSLLERATFDLLTRLPNRSEFERRAVDVFATADRNGVGASLLLFDLNGFKQVNDTYGHHVGDEMLKEIAVATSHGGPRRRRRRTLGRRRIRRDHAGCRHRRDGESPSAPVGRRGRRSDADRGRRRVPAGQGQRRRRDLARPRRSRCPRSGRRPGDVPGQARRHRLPRGGPGRPR